MIKSHFQSLLHYCITALTLSSVSAFAADTDKNFALGADISWTTEMESQGVRSYTVDGVETENTALMKQYGLDAIRLRVWVNPEHYWSSANDVLTMARRAKANGMDIMIDFHYSDWWADPSHQVTPAQWKDLDYSQTCVALAEHTRATLQLLRDNDIDVKWAQVGNETTNGFVWPMGQADINIEQYAGLTEAGYQAVKQVYPEAIVIVHLDNGYDAALYDRMFSALRQYGTHWDMIGMSLYPYWSIKNDATLTENAILAKCRDNILKLYEKFGTPAMIVETGVEVDRPAEGKQFLLNLIDTMANNTNGICRGVFYWEPESCHNHYPLGAFANDRPTEIMDAFLQSATNLSTK